MVFVVLLGLKNRLDEWMRALQCCDQLIRQSEIQSEELQSEHRMQDKTCKLGSDPCIPQGGSQTYARADDQGISFEGGRQPDNKTWTVDGGPQKTTSDAITCDSSRSSLTCPARPPEDFSSESLIWASTTSRSSSIG